MVRILTIRWMTLPSTAKLWSDFRRNLSASAENPPCCHFTVFAGGAIEIGLISSPALSGSGGNLAWGSTWYQYATEAMSSSRGR